MMPTERPPPRRMGFTRAILALAALVVFGGLAVVDLLSISERSSRLIGLAKIVVGAGLIVAAAAMWWWSNRRA
jgi:hypothetical protein